MKKILLGMAAIVALVATSCQKSEDFAGNAGETATVSFSVNTPEMGRAYSDGSTATVLQYAIYDETGAELTDLTKKDATINGSTTVNVQLVTGNTYSAIFWAAAPNAPYTVKFDEKTMTVDYANAVSNDEKRDAFFKKINFTVSGNGQVETVEMQRPFAQLNIGTNDYAASTKAGYTPQYSHVKVSNIYETLNLWDGKVADKLPSVEFACAAIPTNETFPVPGGYEYLAMNYLLVPAKAADEAELIEVEFAYAEALNGAEKTRTVGSVPVNRNHRTNIYGSLLTSDVNVNVEILPGYDEPAYTVDQVVMSDVDLQTALDNAPVGKTTIIRLGTDIVGDVMEYQKDDRHIVIIGGGNKYDGTIKIHNGSGSTNGSIKIQGVNFETSKESVNFIMPNDFGVENGVARRYSNNVTVENCTFTATGAAVSTAVGVQAKSSTNLQILNCTATNMHSLVQAQSCLGDVIVKGATITGKNGVAFKQVKNAVVEGTTITADAYGIRFDGNTDNYGITVKNNNVTASQPFIVRKMTGANNTITLEGANALAVNASSIATEAPAYQIVITNGSDDEAYVKPTGTYTLTGADNYLVYPRDVYFLVATWDEFTAALAANEPKIKLTDNIEYSGNYSLKKDVVIDLNGKSITMPMFYVFSTATIKNGTINGKMYARTGCKATLEGLTFSGTISDNLSTEGHLQVQGGCDVYAKNCTFAATTVNGSQTRSLSIEGSSSGIRKFEGCDFKFVSWGTGAGKYKKNVYINTMNGTTTVDFTNCKLNGKAPNILFAGTYSLKNLTMSGCDNTAPSLEINRAKDAVTEEEWAHISSLIANNKFTQVRVFYAGGSSEYIR